MNWKITVRNFRGFSDESPLTIDFSKKITALIGANNSGKTAALRFFWEIGAFVGSAPGSLITHDGTTPPRAFASGNIKTITVTSASFARDNIRPIVVDMNYIKANEEFELPSEVCNKEILPLHCRIVIDRNSQTGEVFLVHQGKAITLSKNTFKQANSGSILFYYNEMSQTAYYFDHTSLYGFSQPTFIPTTRSAANIDVPMSFDLAFGKNAIQLWKSYKLSNEISAREHANLIEQELAQIFGFEVINILPTQNDDDFIVQINNRTSSLMKDMGNGFSQFFSIFLNMQHRGNPLVLFDEPEIGLHPQLQQQLISTISKFSQGPILYATHSLGLARATADSIIGIRKVGDRTHCEEFEGSKSHLELLGEMSFASWKDTGCDGVLFVEGPHDVRVFSEWLKILGINRSWAVLHLGGNVTFDALGHESIAQVSKVHSKVAIIFDSEKESENAPLARKRQIFLDGCLQAGIACHVTGRRATDNYLTQAAVSSAVANTAKSLLPFEKLAQHGWGKAHSQKIAAAMKKDEILATDLGQFLKKLELM